MQGSPIGLTLVFTYASGGTPPTPTPPTTYPTYWTKPDENPTEWTKP